MARILIGRTCEVLIGPDLLGSQPLLPDRAGRRRVAVFTQPGAARTARAVTRLLHGDGFEAQVRVLPDRDAAKTPAVAESAYEWLAELGMTRRDTVVAVGGGAVTDAAGYVAATYLRGVEAVYVPTTLVGAVDAAIGGKTGLNLGGKNLVGVFRHPRRVVIDTDLLEALPVDLRREGLAEAVKTGLVGDPDLVALLEADGVDTPLGRVVELSVTVKAAVVEEDFAESGKRAILNYGHTIGHAVEMAGGYSHGEAIAAGMVAAGHISADATGFGDAERQRRIIAGLGLPVEAPGADRRAVLRLLALDKKRDEGGLRMVLLRNVADPVLVHVDDAAVHAGLDAIGIGP